MQRGANVNLDALIAEMARPRLRWRAKKLASNRNDLNGGRLKVGRLRGCP